jgi:hypothetical protein
MKAVGIHHDRIGFYTLRRVFRTIADAARDPVAIDLIMGHADPSMGGHYRERIEDSRLRAVAEHVRRWLFGEAPDGDTNRPESTVPKICDPSGPSNTEEDKSGSVEAQRLEKGEPALPAEARPALRLYIG